MNTLQNQKRLEPGDLAPDVEVIAADGRSMQLSEMWAGGPVLLTFLRHFG